LADYDLLPKSIKNSDKDTFLKDSALIEESKGNNGGDLIDLSES